MKPTAVVSWIVILVIAAGIPILGALKGGKDPSAVPSSQPSSEAIDFQFEVVGKSTFAISKLAPSVEAELLRQIHETAKSPLQQTGAAVIEAELKGANAAMGRLESIDADEARAVERWYSAQTPLPADTVERLGWYGELAVTSGKHETDPARQVVVNAANRVMYLTIAGYALLLAGGFVGFCLLVTAIILLSLGKLRFRVGKPQGPAHIYVEAFALYLASYVVGSIIVGVFFPDAGFAVHLLPPVIGVALASCWPMLRGVGYRVVRADWGVHAGKNAVMEAGYGILGYLAGLPIIVLGVVVMFVLIKLSGTTPSHPAIEQIGEYPILVALLAVVFAPITEELIFRGAFLSHLRAGVGIVLSAIISGLIFAAVHPQGWTVIPVLASIGAVLAIIRQWRDSLIPSIAAHALHNGILITLSLLLTRM